MLARLLSNSLPQGTATLTALPRKLVVAFELRRQREGLAQLESHLLEDLGLTPEDVRREVARSDWDVPSSWRR